ncbi:alpha-ketoglutarate-dependent dioxygenase AlkB [Acaryochloris marina]|uniref:Alkylated DNA repair protein n=1 Tax=Acaryochloris marina (strain MBIC 11017) TaxID=329726 RepID=B0C4L3_ACAM1|nr:alpha-ketoglutarate-dependent dioxygenase AlkB [Acaryochloris marina]ABW29896.1 alkylated DNA repair protein [Acaryochloris marina MBIC11017]
MSFAPPDIDLRKAFWPNHQDLFFKLCSTVVWDVRMKARRTASFGVAYNYSQITYLKTEMHPELLPLCAAVLESLGFTPNNCLLNFYTDGSSSMGFHSDTAEELSPGTGVATLSLRATRTITYKHKQARETQYSYSLESGDLLYMSNEVQIDWLHGILKEAQAGPRISVTFRSIIS